MKTKLTVLIILVVIAVLAILVLNAPRQEVKPKQALPPAQPQEKQAELSTSKYQLLPAVKTGSAQATVPENKSAEQVAAASEKAKKITAKEASSSEESGTPQEETYKPQKYPDAEKMRQMKERGIVLY